jgi:quinol-cytochrome oxidoreductase complex cytochrome b subunit
MGRFHHPMTRKIARRPILPLTLIALLLAGCRTAPGGEPIGLGEWLYRLVVGGTAVSGQTLLRFYAWHVMGLAVPLLILIGWHGFRVRRDGGISSPAREPGDESPPRTGRLMSVRSEVLTFALTLVALIVVSVLVDAPIGPSAELSGITEHTQAPWIFLWVQELLRVWPPALAGVLTPLAVLLVLALLPYFDWSNEGVAVWFNRQGRIVQVVAIALYVMIIALTIRAALR